MIGEVGVQTVEVGAESERVDDVVTGASTQLHQTREALERPVRVVL